MCKRKWIIVLLLSISFQLSYITETSTNIYMIRTLFWLSIAFYLGLFDMLIDDVRTYLLDKMASDKKTDIFLLGFWIVAAFTLQGLEIFNIKLNIPIITIIAFFPVFFAIKVRASSLAVVPIMLLLFTVVCFYGRLKSYEYLIITTYFWIGVTLALGIIQSYETNTTNE